MRPTFFLLICCWLLAVPAMAQTFFGAEDHPAIIPSYVSSATAAGDFDNDGDLDLFVPLSVGDFVGADLNALRQQQPGGFIDATLSSGLTVSDVTFSNRALWFDYDRDGLIDLYIASFWICCPDSSATGQIAAKEAHPSVRNRLYRNLGDATMRDVTAETGLDIILDFVGGGSDGNIAAADFDSDGWTDIYANVNRSPGPLLFLNGGPLGFADIPLNEIIFVGQDRGLAVGDVDNDGDLDLFQASQDEELRFAAVYHNDGKAFFSPRELGTNGAELQLLGTGAALADVDNDGDLDLQLGGAGQLLLNAGDGTFGTDAKQIPTGPTGATVLMRDHNNDGRVDAWFGPEVGIPDPSTTYLNRGTAGHWLAVELVGLQSNRSAIGAHLTATSGTQIQLREVTSGHGLTSTLPVHFGLGSHSTVDQLEVFWPSGQTDTLNQIAADQTIRLFEGKKTYQPVKTTPLSLPQNISLNQNFPNPFNSNTTIRFVLPHTADVELILFNLSGQRVMTLVAETRSAGTYAINWNGRNDNGDLLASGVYLYQLRVGNTTEMRKLLLLR